MGSRKFQRYFIVLNEEDTTYRSSSKAPAGYCKIEVRDGKGKMGIYVQNLRVLEKDVYKSYALCPKREGVAAVYIGVVKPNANGRGEAQFYFDPNNIAKSGVPIQDVQSIAIFAESLEADHFQVPLIGFLGKPFSWKGLVEKVQLRDEQSDIEEEKVSIGEVEEEEKREQEQPQEEIKEVQVIEEVQDSVLREEEVSKEDQYHVYQAEEQHIDEQEQILSQTIQVQEDLYLEDRGKAEEYEELERLICTQSVHMGPYQKPGLYWVSIHPDMLKKYTKQWKTYCQHPHIKNAYQQFNHLLLGIRVHKGKPKRFYVGIPGIHNIYEEPIYKQLGYKKFFKLPNNGFSQGAYGYWILQLP